MHAVPILKRSQPHPQILFPLSPLFQAGNSIFTHLRSHCDSRRYPESVEGAEAPFDRGEVRISLGALNEAVLEAELLDLVGSLRDSTYETR
jgi:hypothetical protein